MVFWSKLVKIRMGYMTKLFYEAESHQIYESKSICQEFKSLSGFFFDLILSMAKLLEENIEANNQIIDIISLLNSKHFSKLNH